MTSGFCCGEIIPLTLSRRDGFRRAPAGPGDKPFQAVLAPYAVESCRWVAAFTHANRDRLRRIESIRGADLHAPAAALIRLAEGRTGVYLVYGKGRVCQHRAEPLPGAKLGGQTVACQADLTQTRGGGRLLMGKVLDQHSFRFSMMAI